MKRRYFSKALWFPRELDQFFVTSAGYNFSGVNSFFCALRRCIASNFENIGSREILAENNDEKDVEAGG